MRRSLLVLALLALGLLAACGPARDDTQAIVEATRAYVQANSDVAAFDVQVEQVDGDYARARVVPSDGSTDPAWVFLKRENGAWAGLTIGTAFLPEDYQELGLPRSLQIN